MKKRIVISAIAATAMISASAQVNSPSTEGYYSRALHMYQDKNYNGCIDQMTHLLELNPSLQQREEADYYIAMSATANGDANAKELLNSFLENYPTSLHRIEVVKSIGDCYFSKGEYAEALSQYNLVDEETLSENNKEDYIYRKAYSNLMLANYSDAERGFMRMSASKKYANSSKFYCGYIAYVKKQYDDAMTYFNQVNANSELGDMSNYYKSQIYFVKGDYAKAQNMASKLLNKNVDAQYLAEANRIVGESKYNLGDVSGAIPYLETYVKSVNVSLPTARYILGVCQYKNQEYARAIENLEYVTGQDNAIGQGAYLMIGQSMLKQGNIHAAMMALDKAVKMSHDLDMQEVAFYNYAVASLQGGTIPFGSSVANFEEFLTRYPNSKFVPKVQEYIVTGYMTDNNYERALSSIEKISQPSATILSAKQRVLYSLGVKEYNLKNITHAIARFTQSKELASYDVNLAKEADLWIGNCYYSRDDYDKAIEAYKAFVNQSHEGSTNLPLGYYNLGYAYFQNKQYNEAEEAFENFVSSRKVTNTELASDAYCRLGDCQYLKKNFAKAKECYEKAYNANSNEGAYALYQKALMQGYLNEKEGKIKTLENVLEQYPSASIIPSVLLEQSECYVELGKYNQAIATYKQLVQNYPSTSQGRNGGLQLAIAYLNNGEKEKAIDAYKNIIINYPTSDEARVAGKDLMNLYAADNNLDLYTAFISTVPGALPVDRSELEEAAYNAAEASYYNNQGVDLFLEYLEKYPGSSYEPSVLSILVDYEYNNENKGMALKYAEDLIKRYPDNESIEAALAIKAEIEYAENKKEQALADYLKLEECASSADVRDEARIGAFKSAYDLNRYDLVVEKADELLSSQIDSDLKLEIMYKKALALNKKGLSTEAVEIWAQLDDEVENIYGSMSAVALIQHYYDNNNLAEARRLVEAFVDSSTPHIFWHARGYILLSDICRKEGKVFEANEYLRTLRANYPGKEQEIYNLIDERLK